MSYLARASPRKSTCGTLISPGGYSRKFSAEPDEGDPRLLRWKSLSPDWSKIVTFKLRDGEMDSENSVVTPENSHKTTTFCTGSRYFGEWNTLGMTGQGTYVYQHGCEYSGSFLDGQFHGNGTLTYPMGQKLKGVWYKGYMVSCSFTNADGLDGGDEDWSYCQFPDRRFNVEYTVGLQPAGREIVANKEREVPPNMYDTGDGFFNPETDLVLAAHETEIVAHPIEKEESGEEVKLHHKHQHHPKKSKEKPHHAEEHPHSHLEGKTKEADEKTDDSWLSALATVPADRKLWIMKHCRKGWDESSGYRPEYYPDWLTGKARQVEEVQKISEQRQRPEVVAREVTAPRPDNFNTRLQSHSYYGTGRKLTLAPNIR